MNEQIDHKELILAKEKAELASKAKSNFLATISHEFRTPLNAILGIAQMLQKQNLTKAQHKEIDIILNAGEHLITLVSEILDFAKLEAGKIDLIFQKFSLIQTIKKIIYTSKHLLSNKNIKLFILYEASVPDEIIADPTRVQQIIMNLLTNAIKFTDEGQIEIRIESFKKGRIIKISIADTGIGITKKHLTNIFDRFTQVQSIYQRKTTGAGLGLAICKYLVEHMQGNIGVTSKPKEGSTFWFTLPLNLKESPNKNEDIEQIAAPDKNDLKPGHILVIEDNVLNQKVIEHMLKNLNFTLEIANNGNQGLQLFKKNQYDLIFTDIGLPDIDGNKIIKQMRAYKKTKTTPIIALTAHVLEQDKKNFIAAGANEVLTKPIMLPQLKEILAKWIA